MELSRTTYCSSEKIWRGPQWSPLYNSNVSLGQVLLTSLSHNSSDVGQICHDDGSEMKNSEIFQHSIRAALNLKDLGLEEGDIVGIAAKNSKFLAPIVIGAFTIGAPINTLDVLFVKEDIAHIFKITTPKIVLCDKENYEEVVKALEMIQLSIQVYIFCELYEDIQKGAKSAMELIRIHTGEKHFVAPLISNANTLPAAIICSSGTTGPSKGVTLSHSMVCHQILSNFMEGNKGRFFSFSSLYWLTGLSTLLLTTFQNITRVITTKPTGPELLLEIIRERKVTHLLTSPMHLAQTIRSPALRSENLDSVEVWAVGGAHVPQDHCEEMSKMLRNGRIFIAYGCSEIAGLASKSRDTFDSVGQLTKGISLKLVDEDGQLLGPGERGEVCLKLCMPLCGYYNNEEVTRAAIVDGWFHTGDIGVMDGRGDLRIVDRKKDIMKVGNIQIDPSEIEKVIEKLPEIVQVSVFAVPDPIYQDAPAAMVVKSANSQLSNEDVREYVEKNLPTYKWLKGGVHFVDQMPTTPSGKILKRVCRDLVIGKGVN